MRPLASSGLSVRKRANKFRVTAAWTNFKEANAPDDASVCRPHETECREGRNSTLVYGGVTIGKAFLAEGPQS
jgi:hypothetical protein